MIRISRKADYAVFIMTYLAHSTKPHSGPVSAQRLSAFSRLNKSLVANLMKDLTRAGLLDSVRGVHGGYHLAAPASEIALGQILRAVEGPFALVDCVTEAGAGEDSSCRCSLEPLCPSSGPMHVLHDRIAGLLDDLKLSELSGLGNSPAMGQGSGVPEGVPEEVSEVR